MPVDAIVAAFNEAPRIGAVLDALRASDCLGRVVVASDGSTDDTCDVARDHGADVVRCLPVNGGKGQAMRVALASSAAPVVFFCDADLEGLRADHVCRLVRAVTVGPFGMATGMQDYGSPVAHALFLALPSIAGQRAVRRPIVDRVPPSFFDGYKIEMGLNAACAAAGAPLWCTVLDGVRNVPKRAKVGSARASVADAAMFRAVAEAWDEARRYPF